MKALYFLSVLMIPYLSLCKTYKNVEVLLSYNLYESNIILENKSLSISEFKDVINKNKNYNIHFKNCKINYVEREDYKTSFLSDNDVTKEIIISEIVHNKKVFLENCKYYDPYNNSIFFNNCIFDSLIIINKSFQNKVILKDSKVNSFLFTKNIKYFFIERTIINGDLCVGNGILNENIASFKIINSSANSIYLHNLLDISILHSKLSGLIVRAELDMNYLRIENNSFYYDYKNSNESIQISKNEILIFNDSKIIDLKDLNLKQIRFFTNTDSYNINQFVLAKDTAIEFLSKINQKQNVFILNDSSDFNINNDGLVLNSEQKLILKKIIEENDSITFTFTKPRAIISDCKIEKLFIHNNNLISTTISYNEISRQFRFTKNNFRNYIELDKNILPLSNNITLDSTILNLGFSYNQSRYDNKYYLKLPNRIFNNKTFNGKEDYKLVYEYINEMNFKEKNQNLITNYKLLIKIFDDIGSIHKKDAIYKLKTIETVNKEINYILNKTVENWLDWKGNLFLKTYSDFGSNPFKALIFCFWTIISFTFIFFFFKSDWDNINTNSIMNHINVSIEYLSTKKNIDEIYLDKHKSEIQDFIKFKKVIENSQYNVPNLLLFFSKPFYQFKLTRHKILIFIYSKFEFMAGKKYLQLSERYKLILSAISFIFILLYLIYILMIRLSNSFILSINAFSTLGFGNIPVRGIIKYLAIIEGFIGWFLLSIFLVSLLNQLIIT